MKSDIWYKDQPDLGIDAETFTSEMDDAQQDYTLAKGISTSLKEMGVEKISVGVIKPAIYFLPFGDPVPEMKIPGTDSGRPGKTK